MGVFKGSSLIQFATFRELLENENARKIIGFDMFGDFPQVDKVDSDKRFVAKWNERFRDEFLQKEDIERSLESKGFGNMQLIKGDILQTVDKYLEENPHTRISLLHMDVGVYEPAKYGLEKLFDRVVKGGVVILDDYSLMEGETIAVEEFFSDKDYVIKRLPLSHAKPSYIIK